MPDWGNMNFAGPPGTGYAFPGAPQPGYAPAPSAFGYAYGAFQGQPAYGYGSQRDQIQAGGMAAGLGAVNFGVNTAPAMLGMGATAAGVFGGLLEYGGSNAGMRALGRGMNFLDPFSAVGEMGIRGVASGWGRGVAFGAARGAGVIGQGAYGAAYAGASGVAAMALPAAALYAGYKGLEYAGTNIWQGAQNMAMGQGLANQIGPTVAPGQSMAGQGAGIASMLRDVSSSTKIGTETLSELAKEFNSQGVFQTTRDLKEFKEKFATTMSAVKEIALASQTSIQEASKMFMDLRQQGFYQTADITAQSAVTQARAAATGLSYGTVSAVGGAGAGMARGMGMRGRAGSELASRNLAGVAMGLRNGTMSEEMIMEQGGVEQVALRQSQQQMQFLSSSRGRAIIAAMMGSGGAPDAAKMRGFLGGNMSLEDIVTRAAGSGIGTLQQAGTREAREAMMPYAGMAMVQMAAAQQQQLYGGVTNRGVTRMLGTMGLSRDDSALLLQQVAGMPEQMRRENIERSNADNRVQAEMMNRRQSMSYRWSQQTRNSREYFQDVGVGMAQDVQGMYTRGVESLAGGREYRGGDESLFREGMRNIRGLDTRAGGSVRESLFGNSSNQDLREQLYQYSSSGPQIMQELRTSLADAVKSGDVLDLGREGVTGQRRYIKRDAANRALDAQDLGLNAVGFDEKTQNRLNLTLADKDVYSQMMTARRENLGAANHYLAGGFGLTAAGGVGGDQYRQLRAVQQESDTFFLAQKAGILKEGTTYEDYVSGRAVKKDGTVIGAAERRTLSAQMATQTGKVGGAVSRAFDEIRRGGSLSGRDLESSRQELEAGIGTFMSRFGSKGFFGGDSSQSKSLGSRLGTDGKARSLFMEFSRSLSALDNPDDTLGVDHLLRKKKEIIDHFGPDSPEAKEVEELYSRAQRNPLFRSNLIKETSETGNLSKLMQSSALKEHLAAEAPRIKALIDDLRGGKLTVSDKARKQIERIDTATQAGDFVARLSATREFTADMLSGGFDEKELELLSRTGAGGGGGTFGSAVNAAMKNERKKFKELTGGMELSDDDVKTFQSGDSKRIMKLLEDKGISMDSFVSSTEGQVTSEGTMKDFADTNLKFATAVNELVASLKASGVIPTAPGTSGGAGTGVAPPSESGGLLGLGWGIW